MRRFQVQVIHLGCWLGYSAGSESETSTSPVSGRKPLTEDRMGPKISLVAT